MRARILPSLRRRFSPTYQARWKSQGSFRKIPSPDQSNNRSTGFVSIKLKRPPIRSTATPESRTPLNLTSRGAGSVKSTEPSLFQELFPEEAQKRKTSEKSSDVLAAKIPPLELPTVAKLLEGVEGYHPEHLIRSNATSKEAAEDAKSHKKTTLLVLELASKSLVESDFRRIAPKGTHIDGWTGPGDILKVFPARNPRTFEQTNHYFIIFANPSYARTYQSHVHRLYRLARKHTPTSIESPLPLQSGEKINDEDAYKMLQDFTLCPPSQRMQLKYIYGVLTPGMRALVDRGGYLRLPDGTDRAGRAVLFWVDGIQPTLGEIKNLITLDGRKRNMHWEVSIDELDGSATSPDVSATLPEDGVETADFGEESDSEEEGPRRRGPRRWVLTFSDESEARSFIRAWHKKELTEVQPDEPRIVQTEFLW